MNQHDKVIEVFKDLLKQGPTTTLDVKLKLREELPMFNWTQEFVSAACQYHFVYGDDKIDFHDNGVYKTYSLVSNVVPAQYTYTTSNGTTLTDSDPEKIERILNLLGEKVHWSASKKKFIGIDELHENHLLNIFWQKTNDMTPSEFANFLQTSPYVAEIVSRYPVDVSK